MKRKLFLTILLLTIITVLGTVSSSYPYPYNISTIANEFFSDYYPQINNNGYVVWSGRDLSDYEIFLYDGTSIKQLTDNSYDDYSPNINNNGYVVWTGDDGSDNEIFLYDGTSTRQLTDNSYDDHRPQLNDNGYVLWTGRDSLGYEDEIFLYDGTSIKQLTSNLYYNYNPQINNNGYVVWEGSHRIFLYNGTSIKQLTDNSHYNYNPQINNNGYMVWEGYDGSDYEIFLYDGTSTRQITDNSYDDNNPHINDNGCVVWDGYDGNNFEIFIAPPQVELLFPNGSEIIPSGSIYTLRWEAPVAAATSDILYSLNNGVSWNKISEKITGSSYDWIVPTLKKNKKNCLVKIVSYTADGVELSEDISNSTFKIEVVKVTSPNGGESWKSRDGGYPITWVTNDTKNPVANTKLYYTMNGGTTWNLIATLSGNPGSYTWYIPQVNVKKEKCKVKVVLKDAAGRTVGSDKSDRNFTITP